MFTKTTITAIRTLIHIGLHPEGEPLSIRRVAEHLGESPSYLAKVSRQLVKAGIVRASHGVAGGMTLNRSPEAITLLSIVEACQGAILPDFCQETRRHDGVCAFHEAAGELHGAIVGALSRWRLSQLIDRPGPSGRGRARLSCLIQPSTAEPPGASRAKSPRRRGKVKRVSSRMR